MATFHDSALGSASASSVGPLATTDALAVTAGDLVVASAKWETGTTTVTFDSGASTPLFTVANAVRQEASGLSICGAVYFWIATATGTINPRFTLGVARDFREIRAVSITPAAGKTFVLGNVNAADGPSLATAISAGTAAAAGAGVGVTAIALNGSRTITPGTNWLEPAEFNTSISAHAEYQLISGAGTITGDCTLSSAVEWVEQLALFTEVSTGGAQPPLPTITLNPGGVPMGFSGGSMGKSPGYSAVRWQEWEKYPWATPAAVVTQIGQPYWLWNTTERLYDEPEPYSAPVYSLHRFRTAYQTVGQPWLLRSPLVTPRQEPEEYTVKPVNPALLYGRAPAVVPGGAPWYLWQPAARQLEIEEYGQPTPVSLHRYRAGFQTVGQPWFLLFKPRVPIVEVEEYAPPTVNYAIQFGRTTPSANPGQPWYLWKPWPLAWELITYVEPYDVPAFNPFLIERNVVPIIPPVQLTGSEYIIRARRRSRR